jgi:quercetin dioxygenase-like cupin family protein
VNPTDHETQPAGMSGPVRATRALSGSLLTFDLQAESDRLCSESPWSLHGRNAVTLVKYPDLRVVYIRMKAGARLREHHAGATISLHALSGHLQLHLTDALVDLPAGNLLVLERDIPHDLEAIEESAILLTLGWHGG